MGKANYNTSKELPERREYDSYPTEPELVLAAIAEASDINTLQPINVLDPGAGSGIWGYTAKQLFYKPRVVGVELLDLPKPEGFDEWLIMDYQEFTTKERFDLICGNPPYGGQVKPPLWERFLTISWKYLAPGGSIVFLLKVDVSTGLKRYKHLWPKLPPYVCLPCVPRPSHTGDRNTNMNDLALWIWRKDFMGNPVGTPGQWPTRPFHWQDRSKAILEEL